MGDDVLEGRAVEERGREDVQGVEPAAGLADVLDDEVRRVVPLEPRLVLEGVVDLGVGHRAGVEPDVQDVGDPAHRGAAGRVVRVGAGQLVDEGPVQVRLARLVERHPAEVGLELGQRAVDVRAGVGLVVGDPHRDRGAPVAVAGDRPVAGVLEPLAELAVLDVLGDPVDLLVELDHAVLELGHGHVPRGDRAVDQRGAAAPAVRVGVHVGLLAQQHALGLEHVDDGAVGLEDLQARDVPQRGHGVERGVGEQRQEVRRLVDGEDHGDAVLLAHPLVVLAVGRRLVDQAGAVGGGDVIGHHDLPRLPRPPGLDVGEVVPQGTVADALELIAGPAAGHGRPDRGGGVLRLSVAQVPGVVGQQVLAEEEGRALVLPGALHGHVADLGPDGDRLVGGQGPGGGGPGQQLRADQLAGDLGVLGARGVVQDLEGHCDGGVLAVLVDVVVHPQLVVGQRRLVLPAVRQDAEAAVGQPLLVQLLEGPDDRLHVLDVERLVVVLEVDPAGLAGDVLLPLVGVLQDRGAAGVVELL